MGALLGEARAEHSAGSRGAASDNRGRALRVPINKVFTRCVAKHLKKSRPAVGVQKAASGSAAACRTRAARPNLFIVNFGTQRVIATRRMTES